MISDRHVVDQDLSVRSFYRLCEAKAAAPEKRNIKRDQSDVQMNRIPLNKPKQKLQIGPRHAASDHSISRRLVAIEH
jgi:hypothetical protein